MRYARTCGRGSIPHLNQPAFADGRFSVVLTNPPFGKNLKADATDARLAKLDIAEASNDEYRDLEIGLHFLQRAHQMLRGLAVVSASSCRRHISSLRNINFSLIGYGLGSGLWWWQTCRWRRFKGFCRAKTNFYVFRKIG